MSISVKFFASLREKLGKDEASVEYRADMTVLDVWQSLFPDIPLPQNTLSAVNLEYVNTDQLLNEGDEVAFFPPVTGG